MRTTQQFGIGQPRPQVAGSTSIVPPQQTPLPGTDQLPWNMSNDVQNMRYPQTMTVGFQPAPYTTPMEGTGIPGGSPVPETAPTTTTPPATETPKTEGALGGTQLSSQPTMTWDTAAKYAPAVSTAVSSGTWGGVGSGVGMGIGAAMGGPAGAVVGSAVGGVAGGMLDMWLNGKEKERLEKKAREAEKSRKRWEAYQLAMEERGRAREEEEAQYARDSALFTRKLSAQGELLKTKNAILQAGNLYNARRGRNWYGAQGVQGQSHGVSVPTQTTARDLGFKGKTFESVEIPTAGLGV